MNKKIVLIFIIFFGALFWTEPVRAGFGISPPYVKSDKSLMPGSHYEQTIMLLRSAADDDLVAQVTINAPEMDSWIKINRGDTFDLPKGELQVPMAVIVDVPNNAAIGNYKGNINIRIAPKGTAPSGVSIALGARVDIDLNVSDETIADYIVRTAQIPDFEILKKPWRWPIFAWLFHRIRVVMKVENVGNIAAAPTKVHLDVYDSNEEKLLEAHDDKRLVKIPPFTTTDIAASFPTKLASGQYWGKIKIYKDNEIVRNDKIAFTIAPAGSSANGQPQLGPWPYLLAAGYIIAIMLFIALLIVFKFWRWIIWLLKFLSWPLRWVWRKIVKVLIRWKIKFWSWLHKKSMQYQNNEKNRDKDND